MHLHLQLVLNSRIVYFQLATYYTCLDYWAILILDAGALGFYKSEDDLVANWILLGFYWDFKKFNCN